ncbi:PA14 domain-containing protein [Helicovermis profundi]|uniref:PA14 domain-containing protein n=1 Tax=Helicovermis profundi TaxID=3065157 RepID=A0AAU9EMS1_9FIRM|nr:hypothetical protein HLPR_17450 [Clostridia bacterium S502]
MKKNRIFISLILVLVVLFALGISFADSPNNFVNYMKGNLTVKSYNVSDLAWANQGHGRDANIRVWQDKNIIFNDNRAEETYYVSAKHFENESFKVNTANNNVIFVKINSSGNFGYHSKTAKKVWGYYVPNKTGNYNFRINSDDGSLFYLFDFDSDVTHLNNPIASADDFHVDSNAEDTTNQVYLIKNKKYPIYFEYFNWGGYGYFEFKEKYNNGNYKLVNQTKLYPSLNEYIFTDSSAGSSIQNINSGVGKVNDFNKIIKEVKENGTISDFVNSYSFNFIDSTYKEYTSNTYDDTKILNNDLYRLKRAVQSLKLTYGRDLTKEEIVKMVYKYYHAIAENHFYDENGNDIIPPIDRAYVSNETYHNYIYSYLSNEDYKIDRVEVVYKDYMDREINMPRRYKNSNIGSYSNISLTMNEVLNGVKFTDFLKKENYDLYKNIKFNNILNNIDNKPNNFVLDLDYNKYGFRYLTVSQGYNLTFKYYYNNNSLPAVSNFDAKTNNDKIHLTWKKPDYDFDKYIIYIGDDRDHMTKLQDVNSLSESLDVTLNANDYNDKVFKILTVKGSRVSEPSYKEWFNQFSLAAIENFNARTNESKIRLSWDKPNYEFDKYVVYMGDNQDNMIKLQDVDSSTGTLDLTLNANDYNDKVFKIVAIRGERVSTSSYAEWSNDFVLSAIKNFSAETKNGKIHLSWDKPNYNFDNYELYYANTENGPYSQVVNIDKDVINYDIDFDTSSIKYIKIRAIKGSVKGEYSNTTWNGSLNSITLNYISEKTGELIDSKVLFGEDGFNTNYVLESSGGLTPVNNTNLNLTFTSDPQEIFVMYNSSNNTSSEKSLESIIKYSNDGNINWWEDNGFSKIGLNSIDLNNALLNSFEDILRNTGVLRVNSDKIELYKNELLSAHSVTDLSTLQALIDGINLSEGSINNFKSSTLNQKIHLTWDKPEFNLDYYELYIGNKADELNKIGDITDKNATSFDVSIDSSNPLYDLNNKYFKLVAVIGQSKSANALTTWNGSDNSLIINQYSGHTGKKLGSIIKLYEGATSVNIDLRLANYKVEGSLDTNSKIFDFTGTKQAFNVMYIEDTSNLPLDKANWKSDAIKSLNEYAKTNDIPWYTDSYYNNIYDTDELVLDALNVDFIRILGSAGGINIHDNLADKYAEAFKNTTSIITTADVQAIIDAVNDEYLDAIELNNEEDENGYIANDDNILETFYDYTLKDVLKFSIVKSGIYYPKLKFTLHGNSYLNFEYPKLELFDGNNKRIFIKSIIEYDKINDEYTLEIEPLNLDNDMMPIGDYYMLVSSKIVVNDNNYDVRGILSLNDNYKDYELWKLPYVIGQILGDSDKKIVDGIYLNSIIEFKKTHDSTIISSTSSDEVKILIESRKLLDGSF